MNIKSSISFLFFPAGILVEASQDETILQALLKKDLEIDHSCGGMGTCGTCRVFIDNMLNKIEPRNEIEAEMALERGFHDKERLACQTKPIEGLQVRVLTLYKKD